MVGTSQTSGIGRWRRRDEKRVSGCGGKVGGKREACIGDDGWRDASQSDGAESWLTMKKGAAAPSALPAKPLI
jgi:hypothetical protein